MLPSLLLAGRSRPRRWRRVTAAALIFGALVAAAPVTRAQTGPQNEYAVKAAFLFNFAKFVEWPAEAFATPQSPIVIGIIGSDPFGSILDETTRGERVNGREIVIKRFKWDDRLTACHILFVSPSEHRRLAQLVDRLTGSGVLTVGEHDEFTRGGGMIHFLTENYRIRFAVNVRAAEQGRLKISSKLLSLATIVANDSSDVR